MKQNIVLNKNIAIIGGGPVGFTMARLLQLKGANVKVYERDKHETYRLLGGSLDIHKETGQRALSQAGLLNEFYKLARPTGNRMIDKDGNIIMDMSPKEGHYFDAPEIDRPDFRNLLLDHLENNTVEWDCFVTDIEKTGPGFSLRFADGNSIYSDLVIIADGGMSRARRIITSDIPRYTGTYFIQGEVPEPEIKSPIMNKLANNGNLGAHHGGRGLFLHTKGNGNLSYYASLKRPENWLEEESLNLNDTTAVKEYLLKQYSEWGNAYKEMFSATEEFRGVPIKIFELDQPWPKHENITLIGDAAHVMPPLGGQGVNLGLLDSLTLANNLTEAGFTDIQSAINDYEQKMFAYVKPVQQEILLADKTRNELGSEDNEERLKRLNEIFASRGQQDRND